MRSGHQVLAFVLVSIASVGFVAANDYLFDSTSFLSPLIKTLFFFLIDPPRRDLSGPIPNTFCAYTPDTGCQPQKYAEVSAAYFLVCWYVTVRRPLIGPRHSCGIISGDCPYPILLLLFMLLIECIRWFPEGSSDSQNYHNSGRCCHHVRLLYCLWANIYFFQECYLFQLSLGMLGRLRAWRISPTRLSLLWKKSKNSASTHRQFCCENNTLRLQGILRQINITSEIDLSETVQSTRELVNKGRDIQYSSALKILDICRQEYTRYEDIREQVFVATYVVLIVMCVAGIVSCFIWLCCSGHMYEKDASFFVKLTSLTSNFCCGLAMILFMWLVFSIVLALGTVTTDSCKIFDQQRELESQNSPTTIIDIYLGPWGCWFSRILIYPPRCQL